MNEPRPLTRVRPIRTETASAVLRVEWKFDCPVNYADAGVVAGGDGHGWFGGYSTRTDSVVIGGRFDAALVPCLTATGSRQ